MNPARFRWGMLFILAGGLLLMNNLGHLAWWAWTDILALWPILLIAIGVEKIFTDSKMQFISYVSTIALVATVVWVAVGVSQVGTFFGDDFRYRLDTDETVERLIADIEMDDDDLNIRDTRRHLFSARCSGFGLSPDIDHEIDDKIARIDVDGFRQLRWIKISGHTTSDLNLYMVGGIPLDVTCRGDESDMRLDFRDLKLEKLSVVSEEGNIRILLGSLVDKVNLRLTGEDADFRLKIPKGSGFSVSGADNGIARLLKRVGLVEQGSKFVSEGYDSLLPQIDLDLKSDLSQLAINRY